LKEVANISFRGWKLAAFRAVEPHISKQEMWGHRCCFGLTNSEDNHGEDLKEYYFYLDSTPTHS